MWPWGRRARARHTCSSSSSILPLLKSIKRLRRGLVAPEARERVSEALLALLFSSSMARSCCALVLVLRNGRVRL